jgi:hypothetical protein
MWMKIKTKLSDIKGLPHSTAFFNSLEDNSDVYGKEQYKWNVLLKSFKKHGYDPTRFKGGWIKVTPLSGMGPMIIGNHDTNTIKKFLLREGHHRVAICKYLYGDDYVIEVQLATHRYG